MAVAKKTTKAAGTKATVTKRTKKMTTRKTTTKAIARKTRKPAVKEARRIAAIPANRIRIAVWGGPKKIRIRRRFTELAEARAFVRQHIGAGRPELGEVFATAKNGVKVRVRGAATLRKLFA